MKAIKMQIQKSSQWVAILLATVVAIITSIVVANATQTITTPNAVKITYSLAVGANSAPITPTPSTSVLVMGCNTSSEQSVGQVSLLHTPASGGLSGFITWVGLESFNGMMPLTTTGGGSAISGTHIVYIDFAHQVDIKMASADTIQIHNGNPSITKAGNVTLIW